MPNTRILMIVSAIALGAMGLLVSFAPGEFLAVLGADVTGPAPVLLKLMGGLYLGFAIMNWMAKDNMIGGIYSRPVAAGNFLHFFVGVLSLARHQLGSEPNAPLLAGLAIYVVFGAWFGWLVFGQGTACSVASKGS